MHARTHVCTHVRTTRQLYLGDACATEARVKLYAHTHTPARRRQDSFLIEIPNSPHEYTAQQLSFCLRLPREFLTMSPMAMDAEIPQLTTDLKTKALLTGLSLIFMATAGT